MEVLGHQQVHIVWGKEVKKGVSSSFSFFRHRFTVEAEGLYSVPVEHASILPILSA